MTTYSMTLPFCSGALSPVSHLLCCRRWTGTCTEEASCRLQMSTERKATPARKTRYSRDSLLAVLCLEGDRSILVTATHQPDHGYFLVVDML